MKSRKNNKDMKSTDMESEHTYKQSRAKIIKSRAMLSFQTSRKPHNMNSGFGNGLKQSSAQNTSLITGEQHFIISSCNLDLPVHPVHQLFIQTQTNAG